MDVCSFEAGRLQVWRVYVRSDIYYIIVRIFISAYSVIKFLNTEYFGSWLGCPIFSCTTQVKATFTPGELLRVRGTGQRWEGHSVEKAATAVRILMQIRNTLDKERSKEAISQKKNKY